MATSAAETDTGLGTPEPPTLLGALSPSPSGCREGIHSNLTELKALFPNYSLKTEFV
jgi:hypothetical protein